MVINQSNFDADTILFRINSFAAAILLPLPVNSLFPLLLFNEYEIAMIQKTLTDMDIFPTWLIHLTIKNKK